MSLAELPPAAYFALGPAKRRPSRRKKPKHMENERRAAPLPRCDSAVFHCGPLFRRED
jgi:hypothetical protein